jgi:hypothetical protein
MKNGLILAGIALAIGLAYLVGSRLTNEALAVVVGAICGIGASIPVSIGLVIASGNNWGRREEPPSARYGYSSTYPPPTLVISPPTAAPTPGYPKHYLLVDPARPAPAPREFKIIGGE